MKSTSMGEGLSKSGLLLQFWSYRQCFLGRIRRRIFNPETAEDIFQEACLKFMTSPAVFRYPQASTAYFCRILRSLTLDHLEQAARLEYCESLPEIVCDPQAEWERGMLLNRVTEAVRHLPAGDQRLLAVYLNPEFGTLRDKCEIMRLPSSTMRYRLRGILCKLRAMIGEDQ